MLLCFSPFILYSLLLMPTSFLPPRTVPSTLPPLSHIVCLLHSKKILPSHRTPSFLPSFLLHIHKLLLPSYTATHFIPQCLLWRSLFQPPFPSLSPYFSSSLKQEEEDIRSPKLSLSLPRWAPDNDLCLVCNVVFFTSFKFCWFVGITLNAESYVFFFFSILSSIN